MQGIDNKTFILASVIILGWMVLVFIGKGDVAAFAVIAGNVIQHIFHLKPEEKEEIKK